MPPTMTAGTSAGFIPKDYTPRHETTDRSPGAACCGARRRRRACRARWSCTSGRTAADRPSITSRVFEPGIRAFDSMFPERADRAADARGAAARAERGRAASASSARRCGSASTKLDKAAGRRHPDHDRGFRRRHGSCGWRSRRSSSVPVGHVIRHGRRSAIQPVITFAIKPHENGDRLLLVKLPDQRLPARSGPADHDRSRPIRRKNCCSSRRSRALALRFFVELEQPLLRTNAPARKGQPRHDLRSRSRQDDQRDGRAEGPPHDEPGLAAGNAVAARRSAGRRRAGRSRGLPRIRGAAGSRRRRPRRRPPRRRRPTPRSTSRR